MITQTVRRILSWYNGENPGTLTNLARILNTGVLAGTGKIVILPVDQGFEHGPTRSFGPNPGGYDPSYHIKLAIDAKLNAYAAPLGQLEVVASEFAGEIPLILKLNNNDSLQKTSDPISAITGSVDDALRLGCVAVGLTIYPGSARSKEMFEEARSIVSEAKSKGLVAIIWSYPRGSGMSKEGETAIDVVAYAAHIACQLGAHIVKVKPPTSFIEQGESKKIIEGKGIQIGSLSQRIKHIIESSFCGKRIVIFSGGVAKSKDEIFNEIKQIRDGGGFGSIIGRNSFQRPREEAIELLREITGIYKQNL
ncbi:MAG: class I fructose-bisphosphate aldolase [Planctomycetes bacterium]|nr:class I fructose-bisphosphate aldolase [Planctomycetota bacterium]